MSSYQEMKDRMYGRATSTTQKTSGSNSGGGSAGGSYEDMKNRLFAGSTVFLGDSKTENSLNGWVDRYNKTMEGLSAATTGKYYSRDAIDRYSRDIDSLVQQYDAINDYASVYGFQDSLSHYGKLREIQNAIKQQNGWYEKYRGRGHEDIEKILTGMDAGDERDWLEASRYDVYKTAPDYQQRSQTGLAAFENSKPKDQEEESWFEAIGRYLGKASDTTMALGDTGRMAQEYRKDTTYREPADNWTDDQRSTYGYLYSINPEAASDFAVKTSEGYRQAENQQKLGAIQEWATKNGVNASAGTVAAIAMMPLSLADTLNALTEYNARGTISTPSSPTPGQVSEAITGAVGQSLNDKHGTISSKIPVIGGKGWGDAYQLGTSIANSLLSAYTQGSIGTDILFFGSSAASTMYSKKQQGATDEQAIKMGVLAGLAEAAGEHFSIEGLINMNEANTMKAFFGNVLKQSGIEASEEGFTTLMNNFADQLIMGKDSAFYEKVRTYMSENGMSEQEAKKQAWKDMAEDLAFDMVGGAISGGVSTGIQTGAQKIFGGTQQAQTHHEPLATEKSGNATELANNATEAVAKNATTTVGVSKMETVQVKPDMDSFAQQFGTQAEAVKRNYLEGQDLQEYEVGFQTAYAMGLEGGKVEALTKVPYLSQSQREIAFSLGRDAAAAQKAAAPKKAAVTARMTTEEGTQDVTIAEVVGMDDTTMTFRLEDGRTVTDNELDFDKGQKLISAALELGMDVKTVNTIVTESAANTAADTDQAAGIEEAYRYGSHGYSMEQLTKHGTDAATLTDGQRKAAWEAGRQIYLQKAAEPAPALKTSKTSGVWFDHGSGNVTAFSAKDLDSLPDNSKAGVQAAIALQKLGIGGNFYFFASYVNEAGDRVYRDADGVEKIAPNGWYDQSDDSIHIDLNAGSDGSGLTLYTLSHELTHFIEKRSGQKYQALAEFLAESYGKHGESVDALVIAKQRELSEHRRSEVTYEEAYSEFIADSMEAMLSDGNVLEKLVELKHKDRSLFDTIRKFFEDLARKIREVYQGLQPDSVEGRAVAQMQDQIEEIQQLFAEALASTAGSETDVRNFHAAETDSVIPDRHAENAAADVRKTQTEETADATAAEDPVTEVNDDDFDRTWAESEAEWEAFQKVLHAVNKPSGTDTLSDSAATKTDDTMAGTVESAANTAASQTETSVPAAKDAMTQELERLIREIEQDRTLTFRERDQKTEVYRKQLERHQYATEHGGTDPTGYAIAGQLFDAEAEKAEWERKVKNSMPDQEVIAAPGTFYSKHRKTIEFYKEQHQNRFDAAVDPKEAYPAEYKIWKQYMELQTASDLELKAAEMRKAYRNEAKAAAKKAEDLKQDLDDYKKARDNGNTKRYWLAFKPSEAKENHGNRMYSDRKKKGMDDSEISAIQNIGRISVNAFTAQDIKATEKLARRYWEEMGVKSPFFRAWFGDWRVNDQTQVQIADQTGDARGVQRNDDTGWDITVSGQVFNETKSHRGLANKSAQPYLPYINDIVRKAVLLDSYGIGVGKAKSDNSLLMHSMYAVADIGNGPEVLKLYVEEMNNPASDLTTKRSYQLQNIEKAFNASVRVQGQAPSSLTSTLNAVKIVADLFAAVKRYDTAFAPNPVSKAINADGTPLEMYHGTSKSGFTVFNTYGGNFGLFGKGSYFTDNPEVADSYTRKGKGQEPGVYGVYLSIKNPLDMDAHADLNAWKKAFENADLDPSYLDGVVTNEDAFRQLKENLADEEYLRWEAEDLVTELIEGMGYDGITHIGGGRYGSKDGPKHRVYIAFEPEQIKSSTDNIGTFDGFNPDIRYQDRAVGTSNRDLLAGTFEDLARSPAEMEFLQKYQENIGLLNEQEARLQEIRTEIRELTFGKGPKDPKRLEQLQEEATKTANRINIYDKKLLQLEAAKPLRDVLDREREKVRKATRQKGQEAMAEYREKRKESAARKDARRKIRKAVMELDKLLNRGDKKKNVKDGMSSMVGSVLKLADALFMDEYSNRDMLRNGVGVELTDAEEKLFREAQQILQQAESGAAIEGMEFTSEVDAMEQLKKLDQKLSSKMAGLKDVFARERKRLYGTTVSDLLGKLADEYSRLSEAEDGAVRAAKDENVYAHLLQLQKDVGGTTVRDMTLNQMEAVADAFTMVLTTVRNANKMFAKNLKFKRDTLAAMVMGEIGAAVKKISKLIRPGKNAIDSFSWNNLKPVYAFERLGSETLKTLYQNIRSGQDVWSRDMQEADDFRREQYRKHNRKAWDLEKQHRFEFESGIVELSLEQIMSLYAYSRREQALDHLLKGGFVFSGSTEVMVKEHGIQRRYLKKDATAYNLTADELLQVVDTLTTEQKAFVEEMQTYLSEVMGGKGNEISLQMYGIRSYGEKNYFPIRSAGQYMERAKEDSFRKEQGQISIVNSGFTKSTTPKANNPITLDGFMNVWAEHVNEMSMYHGFALPMEDFRRVYNYSSPNMEVGNSQSVNAVIENAFGKAATGYIDQLYKDLNGGALTDNREGISKKLVGLHKKAAVFASASVVIQQPSAIVRAFALIDPRHFIGPKVDRKRHKQLWEEVKKYAPVAFVKEMGYFDTGMGRSARDFLQAEEYSGIREKMTALFKDADYRDEILGKAPALADELTWCSIWEAVKRETKAKNPNLDVRSDAFLQMAGARFSEVIDKTQVYDSVLSRSANMRSKSGLMNMVTSFLAEPTTSINMLEDSLRKGDRQQLKRTVGAVYGSVLLNSLLVSLVYAARDDDEDETWWEKYLSSVAVEMMDGINPITYYPILRDIWSIGQGFDVERADMSLISDFADAAKKVVQSILKVQQAEADEQPAAIGALKDSLWGMTDSIASLTGLPVKNIRRDISGAANLYRTISADLAGRQTTLLSLQDTVLADVMGSIPIGNLLYSKNKREKLYDAIVAGDTAYVQRLKAGYDSEDSYHNAIKLALRDYDSRIWEAAVAWNEGRMDTYIRIAKEIRSENRFDQDDIVLAIRAEANSMLDNESGGSNKVYGYFTSEKLSVAMGQNNVNMADMIRKDLIDTSMANGKTKEEAEESVRSTARSQLKQLYAAGTITCMNAEKMLVKYGGYDREEAKAKVAEWKFEKDYPDSKISYESYQDWLTNGKNRGVTLEVYTDVSLFRKPVGVKTAKAQDEVAAYINRMPLTTAQKDALWCCFWSESTLYKNAPWH